MGENDHSEPIAGDHGYQYSGTGRNEKGGPGSGNWGHFGRHGLRGGSAPKSGGAAFNLGGYTRAISKKKGPVEKQVREQVQAARPDIDDHGMDMVTDVMGWDKGKFDEYADRFGVDKNLRDSYIRERASHDEQVARMQQAVKDQATLKDRGMDGREYVRHFTHVGDEKYEQVTKPVGTSSQEVIGALGRDFGVQVDLHVDVPEQKLHDDLSQLHNWLQTEPVLKGIMDDQGLKVRFVPPGASHPTAAAMFNIGAKSVDVFVQPDSTGGGSLFAMTWPHELGHAAERYLPRAKLKVFGRGRMVSSYAWNNFSEDMAESFVSVLVGDRRAMDWMGSAKSRMLIDNVPGLGE